MPVDLFTATSCSYKPSHSISGFFPVFEERDRSSMRHIDEFLRKYLFTFDFSVVQIHDEPFTHIFNTGHHPTGRNRTAINWNISDDHLPEKKLMAIGTVFL